MGRNDKEIAIGYGFIPGGNGLGAEIIGSEIIGSGAANAVGASIASIRSNSGSPANPNTCSQ